MLATLSPESLHKRAGKSCHHHQAGFGRVENASSPKLAAVDGDNLTKGLTQGPRGQERGSAHQKASGMAGTCPPATGCEGLVIGNARTTTKTCLVLRLE